MSSTLDIPPQLWWNLTPHSKPLIAPTASSPRTLVIGGGIIGLVTAWVLLDRGYHVTIVSEAWVNESVGGRLTSQIAGALWEYPPGICGGHTDPASLKHSKRWSMISYRVWDALAAVPSLSEQVGVRMRRTNFFFQHSIEQDQAQLDKMLEAVRAGVRGFRRTIALVDERRLRAGQGIVDAYEILSPVIDSDRAMIWLMELLRAKGVRMITETLTGDLLELEPELLSQYSASAIVNATGLSAKDLGADDTCYPMRGALLRIRNTGADFPVIDTAMAMSVVPEQKDPCSHVYIVPRDEKTLILGGLTQSHESALDLTPSSLLIQRMRTRCEDFLPALRNAKLDPEYPLAQGLRPFRNNNVRVERELRRSKQGERSRIVHSYGHGGSGWSLCFGCAGDVVVLVEEVMRGTRPRDMDAASGEMQRSHAQNRTLGARI